MLMVVDSVAFSTMITEHVHLPGNLSMFDIILCLLFLSPTQ